jgi:hypothetical protein
LTAAPARSGLDWLDAFEFPELVLVMGHPVEVDRKLAVEPEVRSSAQRFRQPQRSRWVMARLPLTISFSRT